MKKYDIVIMGDIHCEWVKLNMFVSQKNPNIILQCGDFGWWPYEKELDIAKLKLHDTKLYWCDGNHEHFDSLLSLESNEVHPNCHYMPRGSTMKLPDGRTVLFIGGGDSIDKEWRTPGYDWFPEEQISFNVFDILPDIKIDIVISHTCPEEFTYGLELGLKKKDASRLFLSLVLEKYMPEQWFFGHFHQWKRGQYRDCRWECLNMCTHTGWWKPLK